MDIYRIWLLLLCVINDTPIQQSTTISPTMTKTFCILPSTELFTVHFSPYYFLASAFTFSSPFLPAKLLAFINTFLLVSACNFFIYDFYSSVSLMIHSSKMPTFSCNRHSTELLTAHSYPYQIWNLSTSSDPLPQISCSFIIEVQYISGKEPVANRKIILIKALLLH